MPDDPDPILAADITATLNRNGRA